MKLITLIALALPQFALYKFAGLSLDSCLFGYCVGSSVALITTGN